MATKHTPGPWELFNCNHTVAVTAGPPPKNEVVAWTGFDATNFPKAAVANARLIAAAPDLLDRLRSARRLLELVTLTDDDGNDDSSRKAWASDLAKIDAAIAKATSP